MKNGLRKLRVSPNNKNIFQKLGILNILRETIGSKNILNNKEIHRKPSTKSTKFYKPWKSQEQPLL